MITFFLKTFVNVRVSCITSISSKVVQPFCMGSKPRYLGNLYNAKFHQMQYFKFTLVAAYMGHGVAILTPFSILSRPKIDQ